MVFSPPMGQLGQLDLRQSTELKIMGVKKFTNHINLWPYHFTNPGWPHTEVFPMF